MIANIYWVKAGGGGVLSTLQPCQLSLLLSPIKGEKMKLKELNNLPT